MFGKLSPIFSMHELNSYLPEPIFRHPIKGPRPMIFCGINPQEKITPLGSADILLPNNLTHPIPSTANLISNTHTLHSHYAIPHRQKKFSFQKNKKTSRLQTKRNLKLHILTVDCPELPISTTRSHHENDYPFRLF